MKIAVSSQNFRTITAHAGKSRRFLLFDATTPCSPQECERIELAAEMVFHNFRGGPHPLDGVAAILTASAGGGFVARMAARGTEVVVCGGSDPRSAVRDYLSGLLKPAAVTCHDHDHGHDSDGHACCA